MRDCNANPRAALAIGAGALAALLGFGILAALPGVSAGLRVALGAGGYVSFVWISRSALLRWRPDWDMVWNASRRVPGPDGFSGASSRATPAAPGRQRPTAGGRVHRRLDSGNRFGSGAPAGAGSSSSRGRS